MIERYEETVTKYVRMWNAICIIREDGRSAHKCHSVTSAPHDAVAPKAPIAERGVRRDAGIPASIAAPGRIDVQERRAVPGVVGGGAARSCAPAGGDGRRAGVLEF